MSSLSLPPRWVAGTVLYQEGPAVQVAGVCFQIIGVFHWIERVISNSETDHRLRDPVAEALHIGLAEFEGTVGGEVHRECEYEDSTVDPHVSSVSLLRCLLTRSRFPFFYVKGDVPSLVFPYQPRYEMRVYFWVSWPCGIPLDGVVYHRLFLLEVNDSKDPVVPCRNVDRDDHKVILLEDFKFRGPTFDIVMREYTIRCQLGVPVCACKVTSRQLWIGSWG